MSSTHMFDITDGPTIDNILKQHKQAKGVNPFPILKKSAEYNEIIGVSSGGPISSQTSSQDTIREHLEDSIKMKGKMKEEMKGKMNSNNILCYVTFGLIILALLLFIYCKFI